jgi:hypothetical protein
VKKIAAPISIALPSQVVVSPHSAAWRAGEPRARSTRSLPNSIFHSSANSYNHDRDDPRASSSEVSLIGMLADLQISRLAHMGPERAMARDARLAHAGGRRYVGPVEVP